MNQILISTIMWGTLLSFYMIVLVLTGVNLWKVFLLGIPGPLAMLLWFRMFKTGREKHHTEENHG